MIKRINNFLITTVIGGLVVLLPIVVFILIIRLLIQFLQRILAPLAQLIGSENIPEILVYLIAFLIIIIFCFFVGLFVRTRMGGALFRYFENEWLGKLPWYKTIRDIIQAFTGKKKNPFKQVVIVEVMHVQMTGFITDDPENGRYSVFVPTAPNPTNGFVFHVREDQIKRVDVKAEDAMRTVIGMGVSSSDLFDRIRDQS